MRRLAMVAGVVGILGVGASPAWAVGCVSGAVVGGVAGHVAGHHGTVGALAGCAIGHHQAVKRNREQRDMQQPQNQPG